MTRSSVGIDVGGTFTDLVVRAPSGRLSSGKVPTTPADPALGVINGLTTLLGAERPASVAHGTTIVTNAIVEGRGAVVGLITTRGFRDVLEIARQSRLHLYDLQAPPKPPAAVPRRLRLEVSERCGPDGAIELPLALDEVPALVDALRREGVESVAVCLLHSYANPGHERALRAELERHFAHVCVSSDINAEYREYERSCTTVLNAAVMPLASRYIDELGRRLGLEAAGATLHLLHSAGGMMSVETARARPLALASSGPAAGVAAAAHVARTLGIRRALAFDMGGTTTDVCLIADGVAETSSQRRLAGYPVRLPMAAVESIGAGGGSIASVDAAGALRVGPRSAGAVPGPACYCLGGTEATVTDANLVLGYLDPERVYGRAIRLDRERARGALDALARRLGLSRLETAAGVIEVANAAMLRALRLVSVQRGYDLRDFTLIAYGGAGPVHAGALAATAGIARVLVPAHSGAFSALGCLVSPLRYDAVRTYRALLSAWDAKPAEDRLRELQEQCVAPLTDEGIALDRIAVQWSADLRYSGQNYELDVPWHDTPDALRADFEARHRRLYGYATGESIECVNLRVVARVPDVAAELSDFEPAGTPAESGEQRAHFPSLGEVALPRYDRAALAPGRTVAGPALVEDEWSTTLVYPGQRGAADRLGNLLIELDS
ncbi:MAG: hydantoinase/oxoprolinase family protein [Candidatus Rokuibacteriota bacterium]|nr:MAG: hydantoinase/oxoprolinase family protein [Candidatus Rokubacteria bacterium]